MGENATSAMVEEDDPVVNEVPIFLSKKLADNLFIFQYPLHPKNRSFDGTVKKCHFKPKNQEATFEMGINVSSVNFDTVKAEYIAQEVDSSSNKQKNNSLVFENEIVDKVFYQSTKTVKDATKYALGVYNGKEFHITPVKGFLQVRPDFSYLDKSLKRKKEVDKNYTSDEEEEAGPSSAKQVTIKFARTETEQMKKARENSFKHLKEKSAEEAWLECDWKSINTVDSEVMKHKLLAENAMDIDQSTNIKPMEYFRALVPEDQEQAIITPSLPSNVVSLHALRALPIVEQCRLLLKDAKIINFQELMMLLAGGEGVTAGTLLKALPQVAVLIRGNWVVKSDVLYPKGTFSAISGVPAESMWQARDYILHLFTKNQYVERKKISSILKIPSEEIKEILTGISKLRQNKGWELLLNPDSDFLIKHIDVVQRQNIQWEQRMQQLNEFVNQGKEKTRRRKSKSVCEDGKPRKDSERSSDESGVERNKSPATVR